jgi:hypothetical protein
MKLNYYSDVKNGNLQKNVRELIAKELPHFEGKRVEITIKKVSSQRSVQQNRLWWLYIKIIADEIGYDKDTLHEIAKFKFLKMEAVVERTGEVMEFIGSSAKLNKTDFGELVFKLQQWAADSFGIVLPDPSAQVDMNLE